MEPTELIRQALTKHHPQTSPVTRLHDEINLLEEKFGNMSPVNPIQSRKRNPSMSRSPFFTLPTFSPLDKFRKPRLTSSYSSTPSSTTSVTPLSSSISNTKSSRERKWHDSLVLDLANIGETEVLKTDTSQSPVLSVDDIDFSGTDDVKTSPQTKASCSLSLLGVNSQSPVLNNRKEIPNTTQSHIHHSPLTPVGLCKDDNNSPHTFVKPAPVQSALRRRYAQLRHPDIKLGQRIGKGAFGWVHEGKIGDQTVAVKVVQKRRGSGIHREIVQAEKLAFQLNLHHKHLVEIWCVTVDERRGDALIVMELVMPSTSMQGLIDQSTDPIPVSTRLEYAMQVAKGLSYIHGKKLAHLDVKPANVLLKKDNVCKISDFGSLTLTGGPDIRCEGAEYTQLLGTLPYRAPELMEGMFPTPKADVYSFGVLLWQLLSLENPHSGTNPHSLIYQIVKCDLRPPTPDIDKNDINETFYRSLYTSCWERQASKRPNFDNVITQIESINTKNGMERWDG